MTIAATFLGGAKSRLLPMSIPLRFFATAAIFHVLAWIVLLAHASQITSFRGGLGAPLAAIHLLTLGVLTMTAVGAATQLLPVATRRALVAVWPIKLTFWLLTLGLLLLVGAMHAWHVTALLAGSVISAASLLLFTGLLADNLRRAGNLRVAAAYGWAALVALIALAALGLMLAVDYRGAVLPDHRAAALAHVILGGFGFMGLLAIGFSHVLVPMFALSAAPKQRPAFIEFALAAGAIALGTIGALANSSSALTIAACIGLGAVGVHLWLMSKVLAGGMRKRLGLSFVLVRTAWAMLPTTLLVGLAAQYGLAGPNGPTLFGFLLIAGWLLTFVMGILQRILPFLASMHTTRAPGAPPLLMSELSTAAPLNLHAACHGLALAAIAPAIAIDNVMIARIGSAVGLVGALAFAWFTADVIGRVIRSRRA
jgi:hypothetical protein